ncbi:hypothetical protein SEVIR_9G178420v4 [Setaria viridis]|uniref:Hydrophobic seed protein domain-containing protein n=1 Tax=Setaria viridis TaxID=4556 RepID=A0A4U6SV36_SETVI|nr:hypothetical protein SEVIR_9G178300v2 [Setaria viridis]TKV92717.1 hypothetical protein SEVIR_9G178340v2 [Setaria viridis]TKV92718.1 hypothetical protein SEVIR_9G178380v2 [Setaria viridis]TKV92719.1 hypothetical protein SEVIR_9G178420v2 [Setaria viridis]
MATTRSSAAALFLATVLLLAVASALAQAPAPGPSSSQCPLGLEKPLRAIGSLSRLQRIEIARQLLSLSVSGAVRCVCSIAGGSTSSALGILGPLGLGGLLNVGLTCSTV